MLLDVLKVTQTKFSNFNDDHTKSAPPTTTAAAASHGRVEGKKQSEQKRRSQHSKEPRPPTISLQDTIDQVSYNKIT